MSKIETIVDALENKIRKVLSRQQVLKLENAKLKINTLIREIDHCISQLSS